MMKPGHGDQKAAQQGAPAASVVLVSGHMVDAPGRPTPRFPPSRVTWVTGQVRAVLDQWQVGPGTTMISGGARGADIIAAEQAHVRGARVLLCLALPPAEFEQRSVDLPGTDWRARFRRLLDLAEVRQLSDDIADVPAGDQVFERANDWMLEIACRLDPHPYALIVWDGHPGGGPGGTSDLVRRLRYNVDDPRIRVIDPTPGAQN